MLQFQGDNVLKLKEFDKTTPLLQRTWTVEYPTEDDLSSSLSQIASIFFIY